MWHFLYCKYVTLIQNMMNEWSIKFCSQNLYLIVSMFCCMLCSSNRDYGRPRENLIYCINKIWLQTSSTHIWNAGMQYWLVFSNLSDYVIQFWNASQQHSWLILECILLIFSNVFGMHFCNIHIWNTKTMRYWLVSGNVWNIRMHLCSILHQSNFILTMMSVSMCV